MSATASPRAGLRRRVAAEKDETVPLKEPAKSETTQRGGIPLFVPLLLVLALVIAAMPSNRELLAAKLPGPLRDWMRPVPTIRTVDNDGYKFFTYAEVPAKADLNKEWWFGVEEWIVNGTEFQDIHRGGADVLREVAGGDGSSGFWEQIVHADLENFIQAFAQPLIDRPRRTETKAAEGPEDAACWTPIVYFSSTFWSTCFGIFLGSIFLIFTFVFNTLAMLSKWWETNPPLVVNLTTRLYHRASSLALSFFVGRSSANLRYPQQFSRTVDDPIRPELFVQLHSKYMAAWQSHGTRTGFFGNLTFFAFTWFPAGCVLGIIINLAAGCITLWSVLNIGSVLLTALFGLVSLPAANGQISAITVLYRDASRSLQSLLAEASRLPQTPERNHVEKEIERHISLLETFQKADNLRAKFLGWAVTWGTVKTFVVTLTTIVIGLWSLLRGAGVTFTAQSFCTIH